MKNTMFTCCGVLACVLVGCSPAPGPKSATTILQEDEVKVRVDAQGRPSVGATAVVDSDEGQKP